MSSGELKAEWDEAGKKFSELGHQIQAAWSERPAVEEEPPRDPAAKVSAAVQGFTSSISHALKAPPVKEAATGATASVAEALAASLHQVADWLDKAGENIEKQGRSGGPSGTDTDTLTKPEI